jgi:hypothetical protein
MGLDVWFREDVARILAAVAIARDGLTTDERTILTAICAGFGVSLAEVLAVPKGGCALPAGPKAADGSAVPPERPAVMQLPAMDGATAGAKRDASASPAP